MMKRRTRISLVSILISISLFEPTFAFAWDPVRDLTGKNLTNLVRDRANNLANQAGKFISDPVGYSLKLPKSIFAELCSAPIQYYGGTLAGQANGRWKALPPQLVKGIQRFYRNDLSAVRYSERIRTSNGSAQTFGNLIYFPTTIDLLNPSDMWWMLHELEHTSQYAGESQALKLCEYMAKSIGSGGQHDNIDWESAADRKANYAHDAAMAAITQIPLSANQIVLQNDTYRPVVFSLESASAARQDFVLQPRTQELFTSPSSSDSWHNLYIVTDGTEITYGVDGGTVWRIYYDNSSGVLDFAPVQQ